MRRRDFRPPAEQPAPRASFSRTLEEDGPLEYRTERPVAPPASHGAPPSADPSPPPVVNEHTLSRRALREQRAAEPHDVAPVPEAPVPEAAVPEHPEPIEHAMPAPPPPLPESAPTPPPLIEPEASLEQATPSASAPTGSHWSVGAHDEDDPFENTFSREVGSSSHSTNALVLPQMPLSSLSGPVGGTGEIIVTGMIDVPGITTSTGAVSSVHDSADVDDYVEAGDVELSSASAAPVSALRAVSGHTGTNSLVNGKPHRSGNTLTTVLVVTTVVMAVVAIGLFVLAAVNGLF